MRAERRAEASCDDPRAGRSTTQQGRVLTASGEDVVQGQRGATARAVAGTLTEHTASGAQHALVATSRRDINSQQ